MPFDHRDDTAYVTTQYITERMKKEGAHGILYDSALSPKGYNLALFNDKLATCSKLYRVRVNSIGQGFECSDVK